MNGPIVVHAVTDLPAEIGVLAGEARAEGHLHVDRLVEDFASGKNCFDAPGEALFVAAVHERPVGVGGVNQDPYDSGGPAARVRRMYVLPEARRSGVASAILLRIEAHARLRFERLNLFTASAEAALFYQRLGFVAVTGVHKISHRKLLSPSAQHRDRPQTDV